MQLDPKQAQALRLPRYGNDNPEQIINPFWEAMIRAQNSALGDAALQVPNHT